MTSFPTLPPCVCHGLCDVYYTGKLSGMGLFPFQTQAGLSPRTLQGPFTMVDCPTISVTGRVKQVEYNNRSHNSSYIVLVGVMDITTAHPIIKCLPWEGETGTPATRNSAKVGGRAFTLGIPTDCLNFRNPCLSWDVLYTSLMILGHLSMA